MVTEIPRKKKKKKDFGAPLREYWRQKKCNHAECLKIEEQHEFKRRRVENLRILKRLTYQELVNFIMSCVDWPEPSKARVLQRWLSGSVTKRTYPQNRKFKLNKFGFGSQEVCFDYFKWYLSIGHYTLRNCLKKIWNCRVRGKLFYIHSSPYHGYKNTKREEQIWVTSACKFLLEFVPLSAEHYVCKKTGKIYLELFEGEWTTLAKCWEWYMLRYQSASYQHYVVNQGEDKDDLKKPFPTQGHWVRTLRSALNVDSERHKQDACYICTVFKNLKNIEDEVQRLEIKAAFELHERRWKFTYSQNSYILKNCKLCWKKLNIEYKFGRYAMQFQGTSVQIQADYGLDRPEIITPNNVCYFKRKITVKHLNIIYNGDKFVFAWSSMVGGKAVQETTECYEHLFTQKCVGAERLFVTCDGAMISYEVLMFFAWICNPKNPKRLFKAVHVLSLEQGHSYLQADTLDYNVTRIYDKRRIWTTCAERIQYVNASGSKINMIQMDEFHELPSFFKKIFLKTWRDELSNAANIRDDKPLVYEFGGSERWNEEKKEFECDVDASKL